MSDAGENVVLASTYNSQKLEACKLINYTLKPLEKNDFTS
jgi:hypothetical protein